MKINYNNNFPLLVLEFYYIDNNNNKIIINDNIIDTILRKFALDNNWTYDYYQYIGGIRLKDNNQELKEDTPIFEGIYLYY